MDQLRPHINLIGRVDDGHFRALHALLDSESYSASYVPLGLRSDDVDFRWDRNHFSIHSPYGVCDDESFTRAHAVIYLPIAVNDPPPIARPHSDDLVPNSFAEREWREAIESALLHWMRLSRTSWVTNPQAQTLQGRKLYLLSVAQRAGANVPPSIASTRLQPADLPHLGGSVAKAINKWQQVAAGEFYSTSIVDDDVMVALTASRSPVPNLLQHFIPRGQEYRIYYVRGRSFALALNRADHFDAIDIRLAEGGDIEVEVLDPCPERLLGVANLARDFDLSYCVFDVLSTRDKVWLLDVNPTGSWISYAQYYGVDLTERILDAIIEGHDE